jgi:hypothetical protein
MEALNLCSVAALLEFRLIKSTQKEPDRIKSGQTKVLSRKSTK